MERAAKYRATEAVAPAKGRVAVIKDRVLELSMKLAEVVRTVNSVDPVMLSKKYAEAFSDLEGLAALAGLPLEQCVKTKLCFNDIKYPSAGGDSARGASFIRASHRFAPSSGITKNTDAVVMAIHAIRSLEEGRNKRAYQTYIEEALKRSLSFVSKRNWLDYDTVRNISLALLSESGELANIIAFINDNEELSLQDIGQLGSELSDVFIYLARLCNLSGHIKVVALYPGQDK